MLIVIIGPTAWLAVSMIDALRSIAGRLGTEPLTIPPPPETIRTWPVVGVQVFDLWQMASTNLGGAIAGIVPQLTPLGSTLLAMAGSAGASVLTFLVSVIV